MDFRSLPSDLSVAAVNRHCRCTPTWVNLVIRYSISIGDQAKFKDGAEAHRYPLGGEYVHFARKYQHKSLVKVQQEVGNNKTVRNSPCWEDFGNKM